MEGSNQHSLGMTEEVDPSLALWTLADAEESLRRQSESHQREGGDTLPNSDLQAANAGRTSDSALLSVSNTANENALELTESDPLSAHDQPAVESSPSLPLEATKAQESQQDTGLYDDDLDNTSSLLEEGAHELRALQSYFGSNAIFNTANFPALPPHRSNDKKEKKSMVERATHLPRSKIHSAVGCCARSGRIHRFFYNLLVFLWILLVYVIPGTVLFILASVLSMVPNLALIAADGAVALVIGSAILRAAHLAHYAEPGKAAAIGAVGAILGTLCVGTAFFWLPRDEQGRPPKVIVFPLVVLVMTLAGVIGTSLLQKHGVDLGDTDVLHGARAGALGGVIIAPFMVTIGPMFIVALGILLTPLWIAMAAGLKWVWGRSNATWNGRWSSSSYCYVYGRCGADPEIDAEVEQFEAFAARHNVVNRQPAWSSMNMDTIGGGMA